MMLSRVDLPQPEGPRRATNSCVSTAKSTWPRATTSRPPRPRKVLVTRSTTIFMRRLAAEGVPLDLARRRPGQLRHEVHPARRLVAAQALAHPFPQLGGERLGGGHAVAQHAVGVGLGEAVPVPAADDRDLQDRGVLAESRLHLRGRTDDMLKVGGMW